MFSLAEVAKDLLNVQRGDSTPLSAPRTATRRPGTATSTTTRGRLRKSHGKPASRHTEPTPATPATHAWRCKVLGALGRLGNRPTHGVALMELEDLARRCPRRLVLKFLDLLVPRSSVQDEQLNTPLARLGVQRVCQALCRVHAAALLPEAGRLVHCVACHLKTAASKDTQLVGACVATVGDMMLFLVPAAAEDTEANSPRVGVDAQLFAAFVRALFHDVLPSPDRAVQAAGYRALEKLIICAPPDVVVDHGRHLMDRVVARMGQPLALAKLECAASLAALLTVCEDHDCPERSSMLCDTIRLLLCWLADGDDWVGRQSAANCLAELAQVLGDALLPYREEICAALFHCRFDTIKPVRDAVRRTIDLFAFDDEKAEGSPHSPSAFRVELPDDHPSPSFVFGTHPHFLPRKPRHPHTVATAVGRHRHLRFADQSPLATPPRLRSSQPRTGPVIGVRHDSHSHHPIIDVASPLNVPSGDMLGKLHFDSPSSRRDRANEPTHHQRTAASHPVVTTTTQRPASPSPMSPVFGQVPVPAGNKETPFHTHAQWVDSSLTLTQLSKDTGSAPSPGHLRAMEVDDQPLAAKTAPSDESPLKSGPNVNQGQSTNVLTSSQLLGALQRGQLRPDLVFERLLVAANGKQSATAELFASLMWKISDLLAHCSQLTDSADQQRVLDVLLCLTLFGPFRRLVLEELSDCREIIQLLKQTVSCCRFVSASPSLTGLMAAELVVHLQSLVNPK